MIKGLIKKATTYHVLGKRVVIEGTNRGHIGDIIADALILIPKLTKHGFVSWSMYQQAELIFDEIGDELMEMPLIKLCGHSLGGAVGILLAQILLEKGYSGAICVYSWGSPKVLSQEVVEFLSTRLALVSWRVRHKDIIPFLGWWSEPLHVTPREGRKRKHILDWSLKDHTRY